MVDINQDGFKIGLDGKPYINKDPDAVKDYPVDWATELDGDTIATRAFTVETIVGDPSPLLKDSDSNTTTLAIIWLSAGNVGNKYLINCRITTVGGRTMDQSFFVIIKEK